MPIAIIERVREARQLFRFLKSLFEFKRIQIIAKSNTDKFLKLTNIISRGCYLLYWLFDNIYIFSKACNLDKQGNGNFKLMMFRKMAKICWLLGLSLFLVICCKIIRKTYTDESDLKVAALNKMTVKQVMDNLRIIEKLRHDYWLNFFRALLDWLICTNELDLPYKILGKRLSPGFEGAFGMSAALIYLYSLKRVMKSS